MSSLGARTAIATQPNLGTNVEGNTRMRRLNDEILISRSFICASAMTVHQSLVLLRIMTAS